LYSKVCFFKKKNKNIATKASLKAYKRNNRTAEYCPSVYCGIADWIYMKIKDILNSGKSQRILCLRVLVVKFFKK
jgi:hypothetical protein